MIFLNVFSACFVFYWESRILKHRFYFRYEEPNAWRISRAYRRRWLTNRLYHDFTEVTDWLVGYTCAFRWHRLAGRVCHVFVDCVEYFACMELTYWQKSKTNWLVASCVKHVYSWIDNWHMQIGIPYRLFERFLRIADIRAFLSNGWY